MLRYGNDIKRQQLGTKELINNLCLKCKFLPSGKRPIALTLPLPKLHWQGQQNSLKNVHKSSPNIWTEEVEIKNKAECRKEKGVSPSGNIPKHE